MKKILKILKSFFDIKDNAKKSLFGKNKKKVLYNNNDLKQKNATHFSALNTKSQSKQKKIYIKKLELFEIENLIEKKLKSSLLILDKRSGKTSADEVYDLRRILSLGKKNKNIKIGHSGTLDPKVTGVLVIGLGKGTKVLEYILLAEKVYETEIIFHKKVKREEFLKSLKKFTGIITQLPPVKSSVKREEREREIYDLKLTNFSSDMRSAKFISSVEKGTYIRKLCHDIGEYLGVGAHMGELRRIKAGFFSLKNSKIITTEKIRILYKSNNINDKKELLEHFYDIEELFIRNLLK